MGLAALVFWFFIAAVFTAGTAAGCGGLLILLLGCQRRARKQRWLGALIAAVGGLIAVPAAVVWLDQFRHWRLPTETLQVGWIAGLFAVVLLFAGFVRAAWNERHWRVHPPRESFQSGAVAKPDATLDASRPD